jgi:hypothetical protein
MLKTMKIMMVLLMIFGSAVSIQAQNKHGIDRVDDLGIDVWVNKGEGSTYYYGEDVAIYFRADYDCYVVVYDIDPSGNVSLLFPSDYNSSTYVRGGEVYRIPDTYDDYHLEVSGPEGSEFIYAVASYSPIDAPDFIRYEYYEYGDWDYYYDDFIHTMSGERAAFAASLNRRIARGPYTAAMTMFYIDDGYRHHRWYRYWDYDPYYVGSIWVGVNYPGCEVWIDGVYFGIGPILIPRIYYGRHWVWIYYHGYPCWQDYVYVHRGQRYYVDAKVKRRFLDYDYGRRNMRDWRFKYDKYRNEPDFKHEADRDRVKHTRSRPTPPAQVINKYSKKQVSSEKYSPRRENIYDTKSSRDNQGIKVKSYDTKRDTRIKSDDSSRKRLINESKDAKLRQKSGNSKSGSYNDDGKSRYKKEEKEKSRISKPKSSSKSSSMKRSTTTKKSSSVKRSTSRSKSSSSVKRSTSGSKSSSSRSSGAKSEKESKRSKR